MFSWLASTRAQVKKRLGLLWWYSAIMFSVQRLGDLVNIYTGLWLVPHWIPASQLGALLPLGQVGALLGLPLAIVLTPFLKFTNVFAARGEMGKVKALLHDMLVIVAISAVGVTIYTYLVSPFVFERMRLDGSRLVWLLCCLAVLGAVLPVLSNALQSLQRYRVMAASGLVQPPIRLAALWLLLPTLGVLGFFSVQLLIAVVGVAIAVWGLRHVLSPGLRRESYREHLPEMARFTAPLLILTVVGSLQGTCETFVIRHFLADQDSAAFYILSRFAEIPCGIWGALGIAFFPLVSERHERGEDSGRMLLHSLMIILLIGGMISVALTWCADGLLGLTPTWAVYKPYGWLLGPMLLRVLFLQAASCFTIHEIACRRFGFAWYAATLPLIEAILLYGLAGISFFQPYLPESWLRALSSLPAKRLDFVLAIMVGHAAIIWLCILGHLLIRRRSAGRKVLAA